MKKLYYLLLALLAVSCSEDPGLQQEAINGPEINIYLVENNGDSFYAPMENLDALETEVKPWLRNSEIMFYDWSSHMFFLKNEKEKAKYVRRNFVVKANDEALFAGVFFSMMMSSIPQIPSIIAQDGLFEPMDVVSFGQLGHIYTGKIDSLLDFKKALLESGKLKNGIDVELLNVEKSGDSEIEYTFEVTNKDLDNIYVLDPAKMGVKRFHYFTNGVSLRDENTNYFADSESVASEKISDGWYKKLHPGESMTSTVSLDGFPEIPTGNVKCTFVFPGSKVGAGEWLIPDGRIWLGNFRVEKEFTLQ